jgi:hypothetical protein
MDGNLSVFSSAPKPSNLNTMKSRTASDIETLRALLWRLQNSNGKPWDISTVHIERAAEALDRLESAARPWWVRLKDNSPIQ